MNQESTQIVLQLRKQRHKSKEVLVVSFPYHQKTIEFIKGLPHFTWSKTLRSWVSPYQVKTLEVLEQTAPKYCVIQKHKSIPAHPIDLNDENLKILAAYTKYLSGKRYSESTINTYTSFVKEYIKYLQRKGLSAFTNRTVELFIEDEFVTKNYSISSQRQFISAIKLLSKLYPESAIDEVTLERPKKSKILPTVLSKQEVLSLLQVTTNLKHRVILSLMYSSGLRIGELIKLQIRHIDLERMQLFVTNAKGRKDRYVVLAESIIPILKNYMYSYQPKRYVFEGSSGMMYSDSSIRKFLQRSVKAAKINKKVTPHTLRHSYATHLLENGVGLRHIQELLGHRKPETTMIYTHVVKKDLMRIQSPLDNILLHLDEKDKRERNILLSGNID